MGQLTIPTPTGTIRALDGHSVFTLIVFAVVIALVIKPIKYSPRVRIPDPSILRRLLPKSGDSTSNEPLRPITFRVPIFLTLSTAPLLAVVLLLMTTSIPIDVVKVGIVGEEGVRPYDVLVMFIALAYMATALDHTGALRALAFWVSQLGASSLPDAAGREGGISGKRLFMYLYVFFFATGTIFGNDPVILSGTAFLAYLTRAAAISPPTAWIFSEFISANIASAVLVSSNPTNVLISGAFSLNFLTGYTKYTILPSVISAATCLVILLLLFRTKPANSKRAHPVVYIPASVPPPPISPRAALLDPAGCYFHASLLSITLLVLVGTSFVGHGKVMVWMVTLPAAIIALCRDLWYDWKSGKTQGTQTSPSTAVDKVVEDPVLPQESSVAAPREQIPLSVIRQDPEVVQPAPSHEVQTRGDIALNQLTPSKEPASNTTRTILHRKSSAAFANRRSDTPETPASTNKLVETPSRPSSSGSDESPAKSTTVEPTSKLGRAAASTTNRFPSSTSVLLALPWPLIPFALGMFILVRSLDHTGWIAVFANWLAIICVSPAVAVFFVGCFSSWVLCPLAGTNIGATILVISMLRHPRFLDAPHVRDDPRIVAGAVYALALGSNIGALSGSVAASLAGLLWQGILRQKGILVGPLQFALVNALPTLIGTVVGLGIVLMEVYYF